LYFCLIVFETMAAGLKTIEVTGEAVQLRGTQDKLVRGKSCQPSVHLLCPAEDVSLLANLVHLDVHILLVDAGNVYLDRPGVTGYALEHRAKRLHAEVR
jgi:hypothetical protein